MVEISSIITRQAIRRGSCNSVKELIALQQYPVVVPVGQQLPAQCHVGHESFLDAPGGVT